MRKLLIVLAVVFLMSVIAVAANAATYRCPTKPRVKHKVVKKYKATAMHRTVKKRAAMPARTARGPRIACPAPVVNVPAQAAPVVNVPQQAAPVVNIPPEQPGVAVSSDAAYIYVVRGNQLFVLDKKCYGVVQTIPLPASP